MLRHENGFSAGGIFFILFIQLHRIHNQYQGPSPMDRMFEEEEEEEEEEE